MVFEHRLAFSFQALFDRLLINDEDKGYSASLSSKKIKVQCLDNSVRMINGTLQFQARVANRIRLLVYRLDVVWHSRSHG
jgi:hypothetical protein